MDCLDPRSHTNSHCFRSFSPSLSFSLHMRALDAIPTLTRTQVPLDQSHPKKAWHIATRTQVVCFSNPAHYDCSCVVLDSDGGVLVDEGFVAS